VQWHISYPSISIPADRGDDKASELRETVAAVVLSDPDTSGAVEIRAGLWAKAAKAAKDQGFEILGMIYHLITILNR